MALATAFQLLLQEIKSPYIIRKVKHLFEDLLALGRDLLEDLNHQVGASSLEKKIEQVRQYLKKASSGPQWQKQMKKIQKERRKIEKLFEATAPQGTLRAREFLEEKKEVLSAMYQDIAPHLESLFSRTHSESPTEEPPKKSPRTSKKKTTKTTKKAPKKTVKKKKIATTGKKRGKTVKKKVSSRK